MYVPITPELSERSMLLFIPCPAPPYLSKGGVGFGWEGKGSLRFPRSSSTGRLGERREVKSTI